MNITREIPLLGEPEVAERSAFCNPGQNLPLTPQHCHLPPGGLGHRASAGMSSRSFGPMT